MIELDERFERKQSYLEIGVKIAFWTLCGGALAVLGAVFHARRMLPW